MGPVGDFLESCSCKRGQDEKRSQNGTCKELSLQKPGTSVCV